MVIEGLLDYVANQSYAILLGDFNLHNVAWGCSITDSLGRCLLNFLEDRHLIICNDHKPTLLTPPDSQISVIDLIVVIPPVLTLSNCYTELNSISSDQFLLLLT